MERFDPGTGAGKHDIGRSFERHVDGQGAASAHLPLWFRQKQVGDQCRLTATVLRMQMLGTTVKRRNKTADLVIMWSIKRFFSSFFLAFFAPHLQSRNSARQNMLVQSDLFVIQAVLHFLNDAVMNSLCRVSAQQSSRLGLLERLSKTRELR